MPDQDRSRFAPCQGILTPGSRGDWPFIRHCPSVAKHGDYCSKCAQKRLQNDTMRAALVPGWDKIVQGDPRRKGKGKPVITLPDWAREMNADVLTPPASPTPLPTPPPFAPAPPPAPLPEPESNDPFVAANKWLKEMTRGSAR